MLSFVADCGLRLFCQILFSILRHATVIQLSLEIKCLVVFCFFHSGISDIFLSEDHILNSLSPSTVSSTEVNHSVQSFLCTPVGKFDHQRSKLFLFSDSSSLNYFSFLVFCLYSLVDHRDRHKTWEEREKDDMQQS